MTIDKAQLRALAERVATDRRFCSDEYHRELAAGVIALFAEIDRLTEENENHRECRSSVNASVALENEKLRAELAGLRTGYDAQNNVIAGLKVDNEALRKCLRGLVHVSDATDWEGHTCGEIANARALLAKEASHG